MKKIFVASFFIGLSAIATAQINQKKDTAVKPAPPTVTIKRFVPPVIVKDSAYKAGKPVKKQQSRVPPPPPPVIIKDSVKKQ